MSNTNTTLPKILAWRIGVTVIAAICIANSATAQVQFADQESSEVAQQSCDCVTQCDFHESWLGKATNRLPCRAPGRRVGGVVAGVKQSAAMLSYRDTPLGDMGLHFPYQATQMYYYRRPYNYHHVPRQLDESKGSYAGSAHGENLGYSNQMFEEVHQSVEGYLNSEGVKLEEDGLLEYADWKQHQLSRTTWETPPRYHQEAQDMSLPMEEEAEVTEATEATEEVLNKKPGNRVSFHLTDRPRRDLRSMPNQAEEGFSAIRALPDLPSAESP